MGFKEEFKKSWEPDKFSKWEIFELSEIDKAPINDLTKAFLKFGFPQSAAPFLDFGWSVYDGKFVDIKSCYSELNLNKITESYWLFGSDGNGNPICFDVSRDDKIILLDHEQDFEIITVMNKDISELAACLLLYKNFVKRVQDENGEDAFLNSDFSPAQIADLKDEFKKLNANIFKESGFWRTEINSLGR
ncbi:hypothetical protein ACFGVS_27605 [Mucilaginibacter sp. AW1-7]|uniref:hypothetical protein n=1 Tax=Mucilaginibacter sp. AW1-7 TaxID=3349874 RepID=UPI003F740F93